MSEVTKKICIDLKNRVGDFLRNLKLELSEEKTLITNARSQRAKFLSVYIKRVASNRGPTKIIKYKDIQRRISPGIIWMTVSIQDLMEKMISKGFVEITNKLWKAKSIPKFLPLSLKDIILRFKVTLTGILNYYSFADNRPKLLKIHWFLRESLRKTICRKLDTGTVAFHRRFGKNISMSYKIKGDEYKTTNFNKPILTRSPMKFLCSASFWDPFTTKDWKISTHNSFDQACANCGSLNSVEMHHIKHIKTVNVKLNTFDQMMARINRKQVPLCRSCHIKVHKGRYNGLSLRYLTNNL